jgi:hypothetical protein
MSFKQSEVLFVVLGEDNGSSPELIVPQQVLGILPELSSSLTHQHL